MQYPDHPSIFIDPSFPELEIESGDVHGFKTDELLQWYDNEISVLYTNNTNAAWLCSQGAFAFDSINHEELMSLLEAIYECKIVDEGSRLMCRLFPARLRALAFNVDDESIADDIEVSYRAASETKCLWFITSSEKDALCVIASPAHHGKAAEFLEVYMPCCVRRDGTEWKSE
jgi:hypothetical protein